MKRKVLFFLVFCLFWLLPISNAEVKNKSTLGQECDKEDICNKTNNEECGIRDSGIGKECFCKKGYRVSPINASRCEPGLDCCNADYQCDNIQIIQHSTKTDKCILQSFHDFCRYCTCVPNLSPFSCNYPQNYCNSAVPCQDLNAECEFGKKECFCPFQFYNISGRCQHRMRFCRSNSECFYDENAICLDHNCECPDDFQMVSSGFNYITCHKKAVGMLGIWVFIPTFIVTLIIFIAIKHNSRQRRNQDRRLESNRDSFLRERGERSGQRNEGTRNSYVFVTANFNVRRDSRNASNMGNNSVNNDLSTPPPNYFNLGPLTSERNQGRDSHENLESPPPAYSELFNTQESRF